MASTWSTSDMELGGEAYWLVRVCTTTSNWVRNNGLPADDTVAAIKVPTLMEQANTLREFGAKEAEIGLPTGVLDFEEAVDDV